ncbi:universal stress protein [Streptomyces sp. YIM 98790]|uniref:universal stress protein n=1 Tax=Streptomyces sp. YIM 98790 TaxID=2689077 RepID=UPI0037DD21BB
MGRLVVAGAGASAPDSAFAEAALRGAGLVALHAWTAWNASLPPPQDPAEPYANPPGALADAAERLLPEALAGRRERYPQAGVERRVVRGGTRAALTGASRSARSAVAGARGRGGVTGLLPGSAGQDLLHHGHSPAAVVRVKSGRR